MGEYQDYVAIHGGINKAADALKIPRSTFRGRLKKEHPSSTILKNKLNHSENNTPRILFWDIETAPMVAAVWGLYDQNITPDAIIQDWYIICACWKWAGEDHVGSVSLLDDCQFNPTTNHRDDEIIVRKLHEILMQADFIVAQNGDEFDYKKLSARMIQYGLPPLPKIPSVDTLKEARKSFKFSSNKLDYIGQYLDVGQKMETEKGLWIRALKGSRSAIQSMVDYCKQDVLLLERVYEKMRPYMKSHPNINLYQRTDYCCPKCGSPDIIRQGYRYTATAKIQRWTCNICHAWFQQGRSEERTVIR